VSVCLVSSSTPPNGFRLSIWAYTHYRWDIPCNIHVCKDCVSIHRIPKSSSLKNSVYDTFYVNVYMKVCANVIRFSLSLWILLLLLYHQGIYNCIPKTNHVSRIYIVTAVLYLQFLLRVILFRTCTFTLALSAVYIQCLIWLLL